MRHRNARSLFFVPILSVAVLLVGVVAANAQAGTNVVVNGTFNTNLDKWTPGAYGTAAWNSADADGVATSGSARLESPSGQSPVGAGLSTCVPVTAGQAVTLSAKVKWLPSARKGAAAFVVTWTSTADCSVSAIPPPLQPTANFYPAAGTSTWQTLAATGTVPAGAKSAVVNLQVVVFSATGTDDTAVGLAALFDNVTLTVAAAPTTTATASPTQTATTAPTQTATPTQPAPSATTPVTTAAPTTPVAPSVTVVAPAPPATGSGLESGSDNGWPWPLVVVVGVAASVVGLGVRKRRE